MQKRKVISVLFSDVKPSWRRRLSLCEWLDPHYLPFENIDEIISYCVAHRIKIILPESVGSHFFVITNQERLKKANIIFLANNHNAINCFYNKKIFAEFMIDNDFGDYIPIHYQGIEEIQYPCVVKNILEITGKGRIVHSADELGTLTEDELVSEYVEGSVEYATDILCVNGKIITHSSRIYHFYKKYYIAGRTKRRNIQVVPCGPEILDIFNSILEKVNYSGFCCVNYKIIDNKPILFEINPRMGLFLTGIPVELKKMIEKYVATSVEVHGGAIKDLWKEEVIEKVSPENQGHTGQIASVLFPDVTSGWQRGFSKCSWLDPHFFPFKNIDQVLVYCISHQIKTIFPVTLRSHRFVIKYQDKLKKEGLHFFANSLETVNCFGDKRLFYNFMMENNWGEYLPVHYTSIDDVQYPCVVKKVKGTAGKGQRIVHSAEELGDVDENELLTQYVEGSSEYATHVMCNRGRIIEHITLKHDFDKKHYIAGPAKRTSIQVVSCKEEHLVLFEKILEKVNYSGFCCIDYKLVDNKPILFEINARMGYFLSKRPDDLKKMMEAYFDESGAGKVMVDSNYRKEEIHQKRSLKGKVQKRQVLRILFPDVGPGWRRSFSKCNWLDPHYLPFENIDEVVKFCISHQIDIVLPIALKSHRFIANNQERLKEENIEFLVNSLDVIKCLGHKKLFYDFMVDNKWDAYVPTHYRNLTDVEFPCVVRPDTGSFGKGLRIANSFDELGEIKDDEFLNEYVEGQKEYATHVVCKNGKIINHISLLYHFDDHCYIAGPAKRKNIKVFRCNDEMLGFFGKILKKVNYSGFCCVDYKIINNKPIIFEINPRMGYFLTQNPRELKKMIETYIDECDEVQDVSIDEYQAEEIQSLMLFLGKVNKDYVSTRDGVLISDLYNPHTRVLSVDNLDCSSPAITNQDIDALCLVHHVTGSVDLSNNTSLTRLDGLDNIRTISGQLIVRGTRITSINGLNEIEELGSLIISDNPALENINGFSGLRYVRDLLAIRNNNVLVAINGINSLKQIRDGDLEISNNPNLININGLKSLQVIGRSLILDNCGSLADVQFVSLLSKVRNILFRNLCITSAEPLRRLFAENKHFEGYVKFLNCPITDLIFMQGIKSVGSSLYLHDNNLSDLKGLESLERVGASFSLLNNLMQDISQLSKLKEINGMLGLTNNQLVTLDGLQKLNRIKTVRWDGNPCTLNISGNQQLRDISALSNIRADGKSIILVMDEEQLFTCVPEFDSVFSENTIQFLNQDFAQMPGNITMLSVNEDARGAGKRRHHIHSVVPDIPPSRFPSRILEFPQVKNPVVSAADEPAMNGEFVADPFLFKEGDMWYLFYEVMDKDLQYGVIGFSSSHNGLDWKFEKIVLRESGHLSYPYVFKYGDKHYMIPEANYTRSVRLYEATDFPYHWQYKTTLLTGLKFSDPSIFTYQNKFWLFVSTSANKNCYLYYSDNLFNCWKEHSKSPVVKGNKSKARPAGRIMQLQNGRIIRTSQKCDTRYGQKVRAFEVLELTPDTYKERELPQSPILSDSKDTARQFRMHHFDAILSDGTWFIVADRKGKKVPWCIDLYTASNTVADKHGLDFLQISKVIAENDNTDVEKKYFLENLIEGCGRGFDSSPPYARKSKKSWSTCTIKPEGENYFYTFPEPILLTFEFEEIVTFDGLALWGNRFSYGNSPRDFTIQYSCTGKNDDFSDPVRLTSCNPSTVNIELFKLPKITARFIRMEITSNHHEGHSGGDRVGFHEVSFVGNYSQLEKQEVGTKALKQDLFLQYLQSTVCKDNFPYLAIRPEFALDEFWKPEMTYKDYDIARGKKGKGGALERIELVKWGDKIYLHHFLIENNLPGMPVLIYSRCPYDDFMERVESFYQNGMTSFVVKMSHLANSNGVYLIKDGRFTDSREFVTKGEKYGEPVDFEYLAEQVKKHWQITMIEEDWTGIMIPPGVIMEELLDDPTELKISVVFGEIIACFIGGKKTPSFDHEGKKITTKEGELPWWWQEGYLLAERVAAIVMADSVRIDVCYHKGRAVVNEITWSGNEKPSYRRRIAERLNKGYEIRKNILSHKL